MTAQGSIDDLYDGRESPLHTAKLGLRVFIVVASVLFSLSVVAYGDRMTLGDWRPLPEPWLLWLNTAILISSSVALQRALVSARRGQMDGVRAGLTAGCVLALAFLAGQLVVWQQLIGLGYFAATNPANAFFYMLTALHGLHLLGGLVICGRTTTKVWHGSEVAEVRLSVELCTVYWHFLLVVWFVLFGLLLLT
ncbi:MAG: cytochrome c oxidase subunit 3 [Alphaproteobacteria bacterium]